MQPSPRCFRVTLAPQKESLLPSLQRQTASHLLVPPGSPVLAVAPTQGSMAHGPVEGAVSCRLALWRSGSAGVLAFVPACCQTLFHPTSYVTRASASCLLYGCREGYCEHSRAGCRVDGRFPFSRVCLWGSAPLGHLVTVFNLLRTCRALPPSTSRRQGEGGLRCLHTPSSLSPSVSLISAVLEGEAWYVLCLETHVLGGW